MEHEESMKLSSIQFRCKKIASHNVSKPNESKLAPTQITKSNGDHDSRNIIESPTPEKLDCRSRVKGSGSLILKGKQLLEDFKAEGDIVQSENTDPETANDTGPSGISSEENNLVVLPEEYKTLSALFERMDSSIRLLALRKRLPAFRSISTQVEILSKRKFLCSHLAQMKYAFPEAIRIEKILVHDERSLCMVPDLKVTLVEDVVGCHLSPDQSASVALCKAFRARLVDFCKTHPEGTNVPHAVLPEPFNQENHIIPKTLLKGSSIELSREISTDIESLSNASHFSSSFHQHFTHKIIPERQNIEPPEFPHAVLPEPFNQENHVIPKTLLKGSSIELSREISTDIESLSNASHFSSSFHQHFTHKIIPERQNIEPPEIFNSIVGEGIEVSKSPQMEAVQCSIPSFKSPVGVVYTPSHRAPQNTETTPAKHSLTVDTFMTETPSLLTPKRPVPTTNEKSISEDENLIIEPKSANSVRRSLIYSPPKDDGNLSASEQKEVQPYDCRKTTTGRSSIFGNEFIGSLTNQVQVVSRDLAGISKDRNVSLAGEEKHQDSQASLLGMFDTICLILRSTDCSFITKEELMHKIILNNLEIDETGEVEKQLQLLEELVPEWISKKASSDGNCFYCIKQAYDRESVRARLVEAV